MNHFYFAAAFLLLVAILFVVLPWLRRSNSRQSPRKSINLNLYQERLAELTASQQQNQLDDAEFQQIATDLKRHLLATQSTLDDTQVKGSSGWLLMPAVVILVLITPVVYWLFYWNDQKAQWLHLEAEPYAQTAADESDHNQVLKLQRYVQTHPDDHEAWHLLGQQYLRSSVFQGAAVAFEKAFQLQPNSVDYRVSLALALIRQQDGRLDDTSQKLLDSVLHQLPEHQGALSLLGMAAFNVGEYQDSIEYWTRLKLLRDPSSESFAVIERSIQQAQQRLSSEPNTNTLKIVTSIDIGAELDIDLVKGGTLFVFVRPTEQPSQPVAVKRFTQYTFPLQVSLTDADLLIKETPLDTYQQLWLSAKITSKGIATQAALAEAKPVPIHVKELVHPVKLTLH